MISQERDVFFALSKGRNFDREYTQPIVKVLSKTARFRFRPQLSVRRRNEPHVHTSSALFSDPFEFSFLQYAQQLGLKVEWNLSDLVEEQRAAFS